MSGISCALTGVDHVQANVQYRAMQPILYFVLVINPRFYFEIPLRLHSFVKITKPIFIQARSANSRLLSWTLLTGCDLHKIRTKAYLVRCHVAIQDLADTLIHSREGRTVHGHA